MCQMRMRDDREEMKKWERNSDGLSKGDEMNRKKKSQKGSR